MSTLDLNIKIVEKSLEKIYKYIWQYFIDSAQWSLIIEHENKILGVIIFESKS